MAKRGFLARLLGIPASPTPRAPAPRPAGPKARPLTADRKAIIDEAMRVHGQISEELGDEEIQKMAKAITSQ